MENGRLFEILYLLAEKGAVTAGELADRFEVSQRTIYRDIDALSAAGIPVYTEKGRGGGIRLMEGFVLDRMFLSPREQDEVLFALKSLTAARGAEGDAALRRLSALFRRDAGDWLEVDFSDWGDGEREQERFALIKEAVLSRRVLEFTYYASNGRKSRRKAEPLKLSFRGGNWYILAHCLLRDEERLFRLSRMEALSLGGEFHRRQQKSEGEPRSADAPTTQDVYYLPLCLRFSPSSAYRVYDQFHAREIETLEDGSLVVSTAFPGGSWVEGYILSFGGAVEVLSPPWLRERIREETEKISALYQKDF